MTVRACLRSMRLRTLPLSLSGVFFGLSLACSMCSPGIYTIVFLVLTTALLQILSNLSNELGDALLGTDSAENRQGMHYSIMDGEMSVKEMKILIASVAFLCLVSGVCMIYSTFGTLVSCEAIVFAVLGACAIVAAMKYTLGKNPYGYRGLGDVFVFIFFGLVSTIGSFYICSHDSNILPSVLPAAAIGFFSVGVLNVNNIRDMKTDEKTRTTVAIKLGLKRARYYQTVLIVLGWVCLHIWTVNTPYRFNWLYVITLPLYIKHLQGVWTREGRSLDPMLPLLVMSTFVLTLAAGIPLILA